MKNKIQMKKIKKIERKLNSIEKEISKLNNKSLLWMKYNSNAESEQQKVIFSLLNIESGNRKNKIAKK